MNFIAFMFIVLLTLVINQFAMTQIVGIILFKLPKKEFNYIIGLILWALILMSVYSIIIKWFNTYFNVYLVVSIISFILVLFNIRNIKNEN